MISLAHLNSAMANQLRHLFHYTDFKWIPIAYLLYTTFEMYYCIIEPHIYVVECQ